MATKGLQGKQLVQDVARIEEAIENAARQYYRLVVVAGLPGSQKTTALQHVARAFNCDVVNVNLELSKRLLDLTRLQRSRNVERLFREVIAAQPGDVLLLDNLEILFDTSLEVDPLRLLQLSSRNRTIVASWNGTYVENTLTHAEPGHHEFLQLKQVEAIVLGLGNAE